MSTTENQTPSLNRFDARPRANAGVWFNLKNPEDMGEDIANGTMEVGEGDQKKVVPKPIRFLTHGTDSDRFIRANNAKRADEMTDSRKGVKFSQTLTDQRVRALVAAGVSNWDNVPTCWVKGGSDNTPIEYTEDNCVELFKNLVWVQEQIDVQISDRKNYFGD